MEWIWRKMGIAGFKKSTPKKNLALPFYFSACLQNHERTPNRGQKCAQNHGACAKIWLFPSVFYPTRTEQCYQTGLFRARMPRIREQILFWKIFTFSPIFSFRVFYFVTTQFATGAPALQSNSCVHSVGTDLVSVRKQFANADGHKVRPYSAVRAANLLSRIANPTDGVGNSC